MRENLKRKWSFQIHGKKQILIKRAEEKETHVLMKIFLAKLYARSYYDIKIEVRYPAERRYKPDLLATDDQGNAIFWGECGEVGLGKIRTLLSRYRDTHLSFSKWNIKPGPFESIIEKSLEKLSKKRSAPVDFINFTEAQRDAVAADGEVMVDWPQLYHRRW